MRHEHCSQTNNITTADTPPSKKTIMADPLLKIKANDWIKSVITIRDNIKRFEKKEAEAFICAVRAVLEIDTVGKQMAEADLNELGNYIHEAMQDDFCTAVQKFVTSSRKFNTSVGTLKELRLLIGKDISHLIFAKTPEPSTPIHYKTATVDTPPSEQTTKADTLFKLKADGWIKNVIIVRDNIKNFEKHEAEAFVNAVRAVFEIDTAGKLIVDTDLSKLENYINNAKPGPFYTAVQQFIVYTRKFNKSVDTLKDLRLDISKNITEFAFAKTPEPPKPIQRKVTMPNGAVWEGTFLGDEPVQSGKIFYKSGFRYEGQWNKYGPHGYGKDYDDKGVVLGEGHYYNGRQAGRGVYYDGNGKKFYEGEWDEGDNGMPKDGCRGYIINDDGSKTEAEWQNGDIKEGKTIPSPNKPASKPTPKPASQTQKPKTSSYSSSSSSTSTYRPQPAKPKKKDGCKTSCLIWIFILLFGSGPIYFGSQWLLEKFAEQPVAYEELLQGPWNGTVGETPATLLFTEMRGDSVFARLTAKYRKKVTHRLEGFVNRKENYIYFTDMDTDKYMNGDFRISMTDSHDSLTGHFIATTSRRTVPVSFGKSDSIYVEEKTKSTTTTSKQTKKKRNTGTAATEKQPSEEAYERVMSKAQAMADADAAKGKPDKAVQSESAVRNETPAHTAPVEDNEKADNTPVVSADMMPSFPGGDAALMRWLGQNIRYPADAMENGIQGRVFVRFTVDKNGTIHDPKVIRGVDPSLDREALRVIKAMPRWIPGKNNGRAVAVYLTLPVTFKLR